MIRRRAVRISPRWPGRAGRHAWVGAVSALALLAGHDAAMSEDWTLDAFVTERLLYDDNVGFTSTAEVSDLSSRTTLGLDLGNSTEIIDLTFGTRLDFTYFADESDLDSNDQRVDGAIAYRTEQARFGIATRFERDTTRTSEEDDTGLFIFDNIRRTAFEVQPSWSYQVTRLDRFAIEGEYLSVDYESSLVDYDRYGGAVEWGREINRSNEVAVSLFSSRVEADTADSRESDIYGGGFVWTVEAAPRFDLRFGAGYFQADTTADLAADESASGLLPTAGFTLRLSPVAALAVDYARTVAPSGSGTVVERDTVDLAFDFDWTETVAFAVDARYRTQERVYDGSNGREFVRVLPSVEWRISEAWSLGAGYRYRWQSLDGVSGDAVSNAGIVTLTYRPPAWSSGG